MLARVLAPVDHGRVHVPGVGGAGGAALEPRSDDRLLIQVRDAYESLSSEEREELGEGVGRNIALAAREFDAKGQPRTIPVCPARAYLPSAIDKSEGWSTAAARTPGIYWIDRRYADVLKVEGRVRLGALAFLRRLGCEVAPRLELLPEPTRYGPRMRREELSAQHQAELEQYPLADVLFDDWASPDLDRVLESIVRERKATVRRRRARALFIAINRASQESYADRATAVPAYFRYSWQLFPSLSATWVARLASAPWLTTQETGLHPKAPREVRVLTGAAYGLAGEDPSLYADELDEEFAGTPLADAIGITGRPRASELLDLLEELRETEQAGVPVDARRVQRCYDSLARYCRGGVDVDRSDVTPGEIRAAFGRSTAKSGLVRHGEGWLPPARARRGEFLSERLPVVKGAPELWELLGVQETTIGDCVEVLRLLARDGVEDPGTQIRVYRRMIELSARERRLSDKLAQAPYYTGSGWVKDANVYAVANPALAQALATKAPVWKPPLALEELEPLLRHLSVRVLDEQAAQPIIDTSALISGEAFRQDFPSALEHFKNTLLLYHADLFERIPDTDWKALESARIAIGTGWRLKVKLPARRSVTVAPQAYLFRDPLVFCALDEDELGDMGAGGQAIASFFTDTDLTEHDRAFVAMAWERAFRQRQEAVDALAEVSLEESDTDETRLPLPTRRRRTGKRRSRARASLGHDRDRDQPSDQPDRELIDPADIDLRQLSVTMVASKRKGQLRPLKRRPLKDPERKRRKKPDEPRPSPGRPHIAKERERVGYELVDDYLYAEYGLRLTDYRARTDIGADGVDHDEDLWVELKAHAGAAPDTVKLTASEAERADKKKERYWLVIASGLEKGLTPELVIIPNPLSRLDTYIGGGIRLVGIEAERAKAAKHS